MFELQILFSWCASLGDIFQVYRPELQCEQTASSLVCQCKPIGGGSARLCTKSLPQNAIWKRKRRMKCQRISPSRGLSTLLLTDGYQWSVSLHSPPSSSISSSSSDSSSSTNHCALRWLSLAWAAAQYKKLCKPRASAPAVQGLGLNGPVNSVKACFLSTSKRPKANKA